MSVRAGLALSARSHHGRATGAVSAPFPCRGIPEVLTTTHRSGAGSRPVALGRDREEEQQMRLTTAGKVAALLIVAGVAVGAWRLWRGPASAMMERIAPEAKTKQAEVPPKADL